jgi:hypothetical protein
LIVLAPRGFLGTRQSVWRPRDAAIALLKIEPSEQFL